MPIEPSPSISGVRPASAADVRAFAGTPRQPGPAAEPAEAVVRTSDLLDPGQPPVDAGRVATIRRAIETGTYPVLPTRIADAMIAAGLLLRAS